MFDNGSVKIIGVKIAIISCKLLHRQQRALNKISLPDDDVFDPKVPGIRQWFHVRCLFNVHPSSPIDKCLIFSVNCLSPRRIITGFLERTRKTLVSNFRLLANRPLEIVCKETLAQHSFSRLIVVSLQLFSLLTVTRDVGYQGLKRRQVCVYI